MDKKTLDGFFRKSRDAIPKIDEEVYIARHIFGPQVASGDIDIPRYLQRLMVVYGQACEPFLPKEGDEELAELGLVVSEWFDELDEMGAIIYKACDQRIKHREQALRSVTASSREQMNNLIEWFYRWAKRCGERPIRYAWMRQQVVDVEKILPQRKFDRYLELLCEMRILEKVPWYKYTKVRRRMKHKAEVYYRPAAEFFEFSFPPKKVVACVPELMLLAARLAFEKHLAVEYLKRNNLYSDFERENNQRNPLTRRT